MTYGVKFPKIRIKQAFFNFLSLPLFYWRLHHLNCWYTAPLFPTLSEDDTSPCAVVQTSTPIVALGSSVAASCVIRVDCPLTKGQDIHVEWHLGQRLIPSTLQANGSSRISRVVIPSFTDTRGYLTCCVQSFPCQIVGGVEITAGCESFFVCLFVCGIIHSQGYSSSLRCPV